LWICSAFEAKPKREPKITIEIDEWKITGRFYVTLADDTVERIEGFSTEDEAACWIRNESIVGLSEKKM
jgi:hypothetical protein